jgi:Fe-S-cluster containining protein
LVLIYSEPVERWKCFYKECNAYCCTCGREVTAGDIQRISRATGKEPKEFANLKDRRGLFLLKSREGKCVFLKENLSCALHKPDAKPILCRMYPFLFDGIIYADEAVLKVRSVKDCPGLGRGRKLGKRFEANIEVLGNRFVREIKEYLKVKSRGGTVEEVLEKMKG